MGKKKGSILIVDDDKDVLYTAKMMLKPHFETVKVEDSPKRLETLLTQQSFDVVVLDMNFKPGASDGKEGLYWLKRIKTLDPSVHVLLNTAYGDIELAVQGMREGAVDFLVKPWVQAKFLATVQTVFALSNSKKETNKLQKTQSILLNDAIKSSDTIIATSAAMQRVMESVNKVASTTANVLITGENGTGKGLLAKQIHQLSKRSQKTFMSVDLGALSGTLFESELFGYKKGAFTDAKKDKEGRFAIASGGTLFLDEIGNIDLNLQMKLLSALETRTITPLGSSKSIPVEVRLLTATNKPLYEMIENGEFREDLLYRINTVEIHLPALRERKEDIEHLTKHYLAQFAKKYEKPALQISDSVIQKFKAHDWPGNIRELAHAIERAVIMANTTVLEAQDFILTKGVKQPQLKTAVSMESLEKQGILQALEAQDNNLTKAAKMLGLGRSTLYRKMKKYGI